MFIRWYYSDNTGSEMLLTEDFSRWKLTNLRRIVNYEKNDCRLSFGRRNRCQRKGNTKRGKQRDKCGVRCVLDLPTKNQSLIKLMIYRTGFLLNGMCSEIYRSL